MGVWLHGAMHRMALHQDSSTHSAVGPQPCQLTASPHSVLQATALHCWPFCSHVGSGRAQQTMQPAGNISAHKMKQGHQFSGITAGSKEWIVIKQHAP